MCQVMRYLNDTVEICDTDGRDLIIRFTDYETVTAGHEGLLAGS